MTRAFTQNKNAVELVGGLALAQQPGVGAAASPFVSGQDVGLFRDANDDLWMQDIVGNLSALGTGLDAFVAASTITAGQFVYVNGSGNVAPAQANALSTAASIGVAPSAIASAATGQVQTSGIFATTGLTPGAIYYLSASAAGSITATAPSTPGQFVVPVGVALSATQLLLIESAAPAPVAIAAPHFVGAGSAPTPTAGTGAGTGPTLAVTGSDASFTITLTTGSAPAASNAVVATMVFASAFAAAPRVSISPGNAAAAALSGTSSPFIDSASTTASQCVLKGGSVALAATTAYIWIIDVVG